MKLVHSTQLLNKEPYQDDPKLNADFIFINVLGFPVVSFLSHFSEQHLKNSNKLVFIFHERKSQAWEKEKVNKILKEPKEDDIAGSGRSVDSASTMRGGKLKRDGNLYQMAPISVSGKHLIFHKFGVFALLRLLLT